MADAFDYEEVVETYGKKVFSPARLQRLDLGRRLYFKVKRCRFTRTISRSDDDRPEVLWEQQVTQASVGIHGFSLPLESMTSKELLHQRILEQQPAPALNVNDDLWTAMAVTFVDFAESRGVFGRMEPFGIVGEIAYGEVKILSATRWNRDTWGPDPASQVPRTQRCIFCFGGNKYDTDDINVFIELPCQHIFHKRCTLPWVWANNVYNENKTDHRVICPLCNAEAL